MLRACVGEREEEKRECQWQKKKTRTSETYTNRDTSTKNRGLHQSYKGFIQQKYKQTGIKTGTEQKPQTHRSLFKSPINTTINSSEKPLMEQQTALRMTDSGYRGHPIWSPDQNSASTYKDHKKGRHALNPKYGGNTSSFPSLVSSTTFPTLLSWIQSPMYVMAQPFRSHFSNSSSPT